MATAAALVIGLAWLGYDDASLRARARESALKQAAATGIVSMVLKAGRASRESN